MIEKSMKNPVSDWLRGRGMELAYECRMVGYCDVVGFRFGDKTSRRIPPLDYVVSVELKVSRIKEARIQAMQNIPFSHESYVAFPKDTVDRMRVATIKQFESAGIGILSIDGDRVAVFMLSRVVPGRLVQTRKKNWWRWHRRNRGGR